MSYRQVPTLKTLNNSRDGSERNIASFAFDYGDTTGAAAVLGGISLVGSGITINTNTFILQSRLHTLNFVSMQFSLVFSGIQANYPDGGLFVYVSSTGQIIRIGSNVVTPLAGAGGLNSAYAVASGVIPVFLNSGGDSITFFKEKSAGTGATTVQGLLTVSLFDFHVDTYVVQGFTNVTY